MKRDLQRWLHKTKVPGLAMAGQKQGATRVHPFPFPAREVPEELKEPPGRTRTPRSAASTWACSGRTEAHVQLPGRCAELRPVSAGGEGSDGFEVPSEHFAGRAPGREDRRDAFASPSLSNDHGCRFGM